MKTFAFFNNIKIRKYGSCLLNFEGLDIEITTFRRDIGFKDNRNPQYVEYLSDLDSDLKRRDFIINTLAIDINNNYVDLLGARNDIDNKIIRTVKVSDISFKEDALRILRAIRFSLQLGFALSTDIEKSIVKNSNLLNNIPTFYIKRELDKILSYEKGYYLLNKYGLTNIINIENNYN